jgi:hypothetical protein
MMYSSEMNSGGDMTVEGRNHEAATDSRCEMTGRVSTIMRGQQLCFLLVDPEAI